MIRLFYGDNSFERRRAIHGLISEFNGDVHRVDGAPLTTADLATFFMGNSLFAEQQLIIIDQVADNKVVWDELPVWLSRMGDTQTIVLNEVKPDKRTKTFKLLQQEAVVQEFPLWTDRDRTKAVDWAIEEGKRLGCILSRADAVFLIERVGVDQWALFHALEKLSVLKEVNHKVIERLIDVTPQENVFQLFETAVKGGAGDIRTLLSTLQVTEDPYKVLGLLSGQAYQLLLLAQPGVTREQVAKDISVHPYALQKLEPFARRLTPATVERIFHCFVDADDSVKLSRGEPWLLIEQALLGVVDTVKTSR